MLNKITSALPHHLSFLKRIIRLTQQNEQFCGLSISGSASTNNLDKYSDLDLVLAVKPQHYEALARQRKELAASYGELLGCFTGEHVGEPKVLICLYTLFLFSSESSSSGSIDGTPCPRKQGTPRWSRE